MSGPKATSITLVTLAMQPKKKGHPLYEMINVSLNMKRLEITHSIVIVAEESPSHTTINT